MSGHLESTSGNREVRALLEGYQPSDGSNMYPATPRQRSRMTTCSPSPLSLKKIETREAGECEQVRTRTAARA